MCGISGFFSQNKVPADPRIANSMSAVMTPRGPDSYGFTAWSPGQEVVFDRYTSISDASEKLILVHRRLAILDLSDAGQQPMVTRDGRYCIVFNGEIYNYLELKAELKELGYVFTSNSDTEVLLYAYAAWGAAALSRLVGMFAFAILDTCACKLFLARDCFGIKPLYYTLNDHYFGFASEIPALLQIPGVSRKANPQAVYSYLHSNYTDHEQGTFFKDIYQLPPAHYLEVVIEAPGQLVPQRYWDVDLDTSLDISFAEATDHLRELFLESVQLHLRSDVLVGAALSGGIDSSAIVMSMRHLEGENLNLHTFSYVASQSELSEEVWIDRVIDGSGAIAHKVKLSPSGLIQDIGRLIAAQGEPFGSTTIYAQYCVFKLAQEAGIKVMLDGQGADELLGGYRPYLAARLASLVIQGHYGQAYQFMRKASQLSGVSRQYLLARMGGLMLPEQLQLFARYLVGRQTTPPWMNSQWVNEYGFSPMSLRLNHQRNVLQEQLYRATTHVSLPMLLRYEDRNSMAHSIESRVPFLMPALAEFLFAMPEEFLISSEGTSKHIFRQAMRGIVPNSILDRRDKIGFATPELSWMRQMQPWFESVLASPVAQSIPLFRHDVMQKTFEAMIEGSISFDLCVWRWVNLICWAEHFSIDFEP